MTDPNVGFSIYISDRERERIELERRKQAGKAKTPTTSTGPVTSSIAPLSPKKDDSFVPKEPLVAESETARIDGAKQPTDDELFQTQLPLPIVSVSNITADDTPWKAKYIAELMASQKSVCDNCGRCDGYVVAVKTPGKCSSCSCDLIHHLKSIDLERNESEESDTDEEEWEDDEEGDSDGDDENGDGHDDGDDEDDDGDDGGIGLEEDGGDFYAESSKRAPEEEGGEDEE